MCRTKEHYAKWNKSPQAKKYWMFSLICERLKKFDLIEERVAPRDWEEGRGRQIVATKTHVSRKNLF